MLSTPQKTFSLQHQTKLPPCKQTFQHANYQNSKSKTKTSTIKLCLFQNSKPGIVTPRHIYSQYQILHLHTITTHIKQQPLKNNTNKTKKTNKLNKSNLKKDNLNQNTNKNNCTNPRGGGEGEGNLEKANLKKVPKKREKREESGKGSKRWEMMRKKVRWSSVGGFKRPWRASWRKPLGGEGWYSNVQFGETVGGGC